MKSTKSTILTMVVVTLVTTTWFLTGNYVNTEPQLTQRAVSAPDYTATQPDPVGSSIEQLHSENPAQPSNNEPDILQRGDDARPLTSVIQPIVRERTVEELQSKFRLLETQYGDLSIDDIQLLEESLDEIDTDSLTDLSYALEELLYE